MIITVLIRYFFLLLTCILPEQAIYMVQNFKLLRLCLEGNDIFGEIDVEFYDKTDHPSQPYTTLIIGPNGTGKSNLLRILILLFNELSDFKEKGKRLAKIQGKFYLKLETR